MSGRNSMTDSPVGPPPVRPSRRPRPPSSPLPAPPAAPSASAPGGTLPPPPEALSRRSSQTYLFSRSWCASSPKDPVIASSPAYHDHPPLRLLLNLSDTTKTERGPLIVPGAECYCSPESWSSGKYQSNHQGRAQMAIC